MRKLTKTPRGAIIVILIISMLASVAAACKKGGDAPGGPAPTVTVAPTEARIDIHEEVRLTAAVQNADPADVVWSSSAPTVASVEGGLVKGLAEGAAQISAAVGGVSASCAVTVYDSGEVPIMTASRVSAELLLGGTLRITYQTRYKNEPVSGLNYSWSSSDPSVVTVADDGAGTVTLTASASKTGAATVSGSTEYLGNSLTVSIPVGVREDVLFGLSGLSPADGAYNVTVLRTKPAGTLETELNSTFVPVPSVIYNGTPVASPAVVWQVEDGAAASVDPASGVITPLAVGTATVKGTYVTDAGGSYDIYVAVTVALPTVPITAENPVFEKMREGAKAFVLPPAAQGDGTLTAFKIGGTDALGSYNAENGVVTLDAAAFGAAASGVNLAARAETPLAAYAFAVDIYDKLFATKAEFDELAALSRAHDGDAADRVWSGTWGLKANIDYNGTFAVFCGIWDSSGATGTRSPDTGWVGTFDGRGHYINGLTLAADLPSGVFGNIGATGVVKNVAFINADLHTASQGDAPHPRYTNFLAWASHGLVENVLVSATVTDPYAAVVTTLGSVLMPRLVPNSGAVVRNVMAELKNIDSMPAWAAVAVKSDAQIGGFDAYQNSYAIGPASSGVAGGVADRDYNLPGLYPSIDAFVAAAPDTSSFDPAIWDTSARIPLFKSVTAAGILLQGEGSLSVVAGDSIPLYPVTDVLGGLTYALGEGAPEGITIDGDTVTVSDAVTAPSFTVTASSAKYGVSGGAVTVTVNQATKVTAAATALYEASRDTAQTAAYDISALAGLESLSSDWSGLTVVNVSIGGVPVAGTAYALSSAGVLTLNKSALRANYGAKTIKILVSAGGGYKLINIPADVVTLAIASKADFDLWPALSLADDGDASDYVWSGHFILAANIEYNADLKSFAGRWDSSARAGTAGAAYGWRGVFDGRGHYINGLTLVGDVYGGLFGDIGTGGVVKNVAFTNAAVVLVAGNKKFSHFLAYANRGVIENVSVSGSVINRNNANNGTIAGLGDGTTMFVSKSLDGGTARNVMIELAACGDMTSAPFFSAAVMAETTDPASGVYAIGHSVNSFVDGWPQITEFTNGAYPNTGAFKAANIDLSGFDDSVWDTSSAYIPMFKSVTASGLALQNQGPLTVAVGESIKLPEPAAAGAVKVYGDVIYKLAAPVAGVTLANGVLSVAPDCAASSASVIAKSIRYGLESAPITVSVAAHANVLSSATALVYETARDETTAATFDLATLGEFAAMAPLLANLTVDSVSLNGAPVTPALDPDFNLAADYKLTFGKAFIKSNYGANIITIAAHDAASASYRITLKADFVTLAVGTQADFAAMPAAARAEDGNATDRVWSGHFILTANIDYGGTAFASFAGRWNSGGNPDTTPPNDTTGWVATFDGRGKYIKNLKLSGNIADGVFGDIGKAGVVKNVAFIDCDLNMAANHQNRYSGFLAWENRGVIENVFISARKTGGQGLASTGSSLMPRSNKIGVIRNVMLELLNTPWDSGAFDFNYQLHNVTNLYSVGEWLKKLVSNTPTKAFYPGLAYESVAAFDSAKTSLNLADFDPSVWDTSTKIPVFKTHKADFTEAESTKYN
ncbi:MAG: Ig-like domain-containing protein [Clostridiales bacterium]|nr:Ig-like domain-containing protein [Clostridiales bacterium]